MAVLRQVHRPTDWRRGHQRMFAAQYRGSYLNIAGAYGAGGDRPSLFGLPLVPNARKVETPGLKLDSLMVARGRATVELGGGWSAPALPHSLFPYQHTW